MKSYPQESLFRRALFYQELAKENMFVALMCVVAAYPH